jgi:maltokinase
VPDRGWVLLDFEGEPLRPLAERSLPDQPLRDVAGMLRSFDYAAGSWEQSHPGASAREWAVDAQRAFLDGYAAESGRDPRADSALLTAFQLDKALYEVVYEARNRPTWLTIPTAAVARLLDDARRDPS